MSDASQRVVVLGASPKPERYSNKAVRLLRQLGHEVVPVHPAADQIENIPAVSGLADIQGAIDTLTVYVSPDISSGLADLIVAVAPKRVIFNPGSENRTLIETLSAEGIATEEACTLMLLNTGNFSQTGQHPDGSTECRPPDVETTSSETHGGRHSVEPNN